MDIAVDKIAAFVDYARRYDVKEGVSDPDSGSNGIDDGMTDVLIDSGEDSVDIELQGFISGLNDDERANLVALVWIGRGDFAPEEWEDAVAQAIERREGSTARYLLGIPNVADLADEGLAQMTLVQDLPDARDPEERAQAPQGLHPELDEENAGPEPDDA